jgi:hypothetical protein
VAEQLELQSHFNDMDTMMDDMSFEYTDLSEEELNSMSMEERVSRMLRTGVVDQGRDQLNGLI